MMLRAALPVLASLLFVILARPVLGSLGQRVRDLGELRAFLVAAEDADLLRRDLVHDRTLLEQQLVGVRGLLFKAHDEGQVLGYVFSEARKADLVVEQIHPLQPEIERGFGTLSIDLVVTGPFHPLMRFLNSLERSKRPIRLSQMEMARKPDGSLRCEVTVVVSVLDDTQTRVR
jgi:hypothetical protein